mmetsp:Transcript_116250/g.328875  ORF Transcript_116250/g.328875 Transcript_116250/m.328875 type:complete len:231 (+) Transcript_116250:782-1474(+)
MSITNFVHPPAPEAPASGTLEKTRTRRVCGPDPPAAARRSAARGCRGNKASLSFSRAAMAAESGNLHNACAWPASETNITTAAAASPPITGSTTEHGCLHRSSRTSPPGAGAKSNIRISGSPPALAMESLRPTAAAATVPTQSLLEELADAQQSVVGSGSNGGDVGGVFNVAAAAEIESSHRRCSASLLQLSNTPPTRTQCGLEGSSTTAAPVSGKCPRGVSSKSPGGLK